MVESEEFQGKQFLMISSDRRPSRAAGTGNSKQGQGRAGQGRRGAGRPVKAVSRFLFVGWTDWTCTDIVTDLWWR